MLTPEIEAGFAKLQETIEAEKAEAQDVIKAAVAQAIAPLEQQIADLTAQIANAGDPSEILARLTESVEAVKSIVTPAE